MARVVSSIDKVGVGGVIIAAFSCTACFPALGALAATLGLGFLSPLEGVAINILLPLFAIIAYWQPSIHCGTTAGVLTYSIQPYY